MTNQYLIKVKKVNLNDSKTNAFYSIFKQNMNFIDFPKISHKDVFAGTYKNGIHFIFKNSCLVTALNQLQNMEKKHSSIKIRSMHLVSNGFVKITQ